MRPGVKEEVETCLTVEITGDNTNIVSRSVARFGLRSIREELEMISAGSSLVEQQPLGFREEKLLDVIFSFSVSQLMAITGRW